MVPRLQLLVASMVLVACGPPRLVGDTGEDDTSSSSNPTTTASTSDATSDSTGLETETGDNPTSAFVPPSDWRSPSSCDPWIQDCEDGEKCVPYASSGGVWDANKCVPIMGDRASGEPCWYGGLEDATDDCDATTMCWNVMDVDGEFVGVCHPFCTGTPDNPMCPEGSFCPISGDGTLNVCVDTCNPLAQDCDEGLACYWGYAEFMCSFTSSNLGLNEPCGYVNDCAPGLVCLTAEVFPECEGSACCTSWCDLELGDGQCDAIPGTQCVPFFEEGEQLPEYGNVGVCIVP